jgi:hypothetical protein
VAARRERREVRLRLPVHTEAPGFRDALTQRAGLQASVVGDTGVIAPDQSTPDLLSASRLVRAGEDRHRLWKALETNPRRDYMTEHHDRAMADVKRMMDMQSPEGVVGALSLLLLVTSNAEIRRLLEAELDGIFTAFPRSTLWMLRVDDRLLSRISLTHILFQRALTPDLPLGKDGDEAFRRSLQAQSGTMGVAFADAVQPIFLAFSPAATGYAFNWAPHALVLEYGGVSDLRRPIPPSLGALYESRALGPPVADKGLSAWSKNVPKDALGSLLAWWVDRLNRLYALATDPTRFGTTGGWHDASGQLAYLLTIERILADMRTLGALPQASHLVRLTMAFDLLDKLETIMGYGPRARKRGPEFGSGRGFERLLDRSRTLPQLERAFGNMPLRVGGRFAARARELFDEVYEEVREGVLVTRTAVKGVRVGQTELELIPWDAYVGQVVRSVRNSSHGLLDQLAGRQVDVAATHTGSLPAALPDLAAIIAIGLLADPEGLWAQAIPS